MSGGESEREKQAAVVQTLGTLEVQHPDPRKEFPLFAAGLDFARETAGPIAAAFLNALPKEWTSDHLVIDSTLVWLGPGFRQGELVWCHEPFPGRTDGATGQSNRQRQAEHLACCWGPTGIDFLSGESRALELSDEPLSMSGIRERHERLESAIQSGRLNIQHIAPCTIYRYGWGAFHRHSAATSPGFQFWIRATRGDDRPLVNGIRNATNL
ncbi:hypothetical protein SH661x_001329 [Planctomicrobium sp. SH661]|uniref:hypothetical protein n=1 Tax=Planctomicrobium sp. SH661 TaxID=3448124 RepID=UPI003F5C6BF4